MKKVTIYLVDGSTISTNVEKWDRSTTIDSFKGVYTWGYDNDYIIVNGDHIVKIHVEDM